LTNGAVTMNHRSRLTWQEYKQYLAAPPGHRHSAEPSVRDGGFGSRPAQQHSRISDPGIPMPPSPHATVAQDWVASLVKT
jgi:hypothetical protein